MKIVISVMSSIFGKGGTAIRMESIFELMRKRYDVIRIIQGNKNNNKLENTIIVTPPRSKLWNLKLIPVIIKNKFDCVYCSNDWYGFITYFILSIIYKYKIIFEAQGIFSEEAKDSGRSRSFIKLSRILEIFAVKHADYVITLSNDIFSFYKKHNKNIDLIQLFVDENVFKKNKEIDKYKTKKDSKMIGIIGPFYTRYNEDFLYFFYNILNRFDDRINFVVIGRCDNKIKTDKIIYTGHLESIQDYVNQLSRLDAVLAYKKVIPGPYTKAIESMSCSLPVFTTPKGMVGLEHAKHGRDIFFFREAELVDKINELIFDDELMDKIGRNARVTIEKYYSKKVNEKKLIDILENLCGKQCK